MQLFSEKQTQFIKESTKRFNLAHGSVRSGKTVCTLFRFLQEATLCPDSQIIMVGHTASTLYSNVIRLIFESPQLEIFRHFCTWYRGNQELKFGDKTIKIYGAKDEGASRSLYGLSVSLAYCDEMVLYPNSIIQLLRTRMSNPHSKLFASMNPAQPSHILKEWIDNGRSGKDPNVYDLHFKVEDNPFLPKVFIEDIKSSLSGVFYKRLYAGEWCLAEGSIFDFFDPNLHVVKRPPCAADYWILGIDYGTDNAFAAVLIGVSTGINTQTGKKVWVEKEFFWDHKKRGRQLAPSEYADAIEKMIDGYYVKCVYMDPSAVYFKQELSRRKIHVSQTNNDVLHGIGALCDAFKNGWLTIVDECTNLIREIEGYVWDDKKCKLGEDEPMKVDDHAVDALRYAILSHKVVTYNPDSLYRDHQHQAMYGFVNI
jgi:PBSX family phage terminase large subunit